jgi:hypothetical protein
MIHPHNPLPMKRLDTLTLPLWGAARLERGGHAVSLRLKALAILYYIALEGQADRADLAAMFWENADPQANLRVELHHLRGVLRSCGVDAFARHQNPLVLPEGITVDRQRGGDKILEGLERLTGVSASFDVWLEWQRRTIAEPNDGTSDREALLAELSINLPKSGVLILQALPGSERTAFAHSLARWLGMGFSEGLIGNEQTLKYVKSPFPSDLKTSVLNAKGLIVLARSAFGETPRSLLELSEALPRSRVQTLNLPPLAWEHVRQGSLSSLPFKNAAALYLSTHGLPALLKERLQLEPNVAYAEAWQLAPAPAKFLAKLHLELRYLPMEARIALEKLVVHPGEFVDAFAAALEADAHLEEFERRGWLEYRNNRWRFKHEVVRRVLHEGLQPGRRSRTHKRAALHFVDSGNAIAATYHQLHAQDTADWQALAGQLSPVQQAALKSWMRRSPSLSFEAQSWLDPAPYTASAPQRPGAELALLEAARNGEGFSGEDGRFSLVRTQAHAERASVHFAPLEEAALLRIRGRGFVENTLGIGLEGTAEGLVICAAGRHTPHADAGALRFLDVDRAFKVDADLVVPASGAFEHWVYLRAGLEWRIYSRMERGIMELELTAFRAHGEGAPQGVHQL